MVEKNPKFDITTMLEKPSTRHKKEANPSCPSVTLAVSALVLRARLAVLPL